MPDIKINFAMYSQLLSTFNSYAFNNTTQILLSNLTDRELREILCALRQEPMYANLAHLVRVALFLNISHGIDRSLYMTHFMLISVEEFRNDRRSIVAGDLKPESVVEALQDYDQLQEKVEILFGGDAEGVLMAAFDPELALPPARRSTVAPSCETVYQIVLACQSITTQGECDPSVEQSDEKQAKTKCFHELLAFQAKIADLQLSAISDPFEHFSELVLRFMVYRNSVLALHDIVPFPSLPQTMKHWSNAMGGHYLKANHTFAEVAGFKTDATSVYGHFTPDLLIEEGYLNEYVQALVDLSIDGDLVAFCAHSKQNFGELYHGFERFILNYLQNENHQNSKEQLEKWCNFGLKPCTLLKIIDSSEFSGSQEVKYDYCLRKDSYIQSCAKIYGFTDYTINMVACS